MPVYSTFSEAIEAMRARGFVHTFTIQKEEVYCPELSTVIPPEQLTLIEHHQVPSPDSIGGEREVFGFRTDDNLLGLMTSTYAEYDMEGFKKIFTRCKLGKGMRA